LLVGVEVLVIGQADLLEVVGPTGVLGEDGGRRQGEHGDDQRGTEHGCDLLRGNAAQWAATRGKGLALRPLRMYCSNSGLNLRMAFLTGQPAPSDRPQIVVPGMMPMRWPTSSRMSRSSRRPWPCRSRSMIFSIQPVPSRHGVHWPHDSCEKKRQMLYTT